VPVAIVTGAARGIGAATARRLVADGWNVVLVDRCADDPALSYSLATPAELEAVAAELGAGVITHVADVRDADELASANALALDRFGRVDAAVASAGVVAGGGPVWEMADAAWDAVIETDLRGVWNLARTVVPSLIEYSDGNARFVAIASAAGLRGMPRLAAYNAAKHAVIGFVRGLAADLGELGVTANAVCPGSTDTPILAASADIYDLASPAEFAHHHVIGRILDPAEVAELVGWLCSPASSGVTGTALPVDGGMTSH